jgi:hypothetical protein
MAYLRQRCDLLELEAVLPQQAGFPGHPDLYRYLRAEFNPKEKIQEKRGIVRLARRFFHEIKTIPPLTFASTSLE